MKLRTTIALLLVAATVHGQSALEVSKVPDLYPVTTPRYSPKYRFIPVWHLRYISGITIKNPKVPHIKSLQSAVYYRLHAGLLPIREQRIICPTETRDIAALAPTVYQRRKGEEITAYASRPQEILYVIDGMRVMR